MLLAISGLGVLQLSVDTSTDSILDRQSPAYAFHRESQALFGGEEILVAAVAGRRPFDPDALSEVERLSDALASTPGVRRVDSLATVPLIRATPDGALDLSTPLDQGVPEDAAGLRRLASEVLADRVAPGALVSRDGRVLAVNLLLEADPAVPFDEIVERVVAEIDAGDTRISGVPVFRTAINTRTRSELLFFVPVTIAVMALLLLAVFGRLRAVVLPLLAGAAGGWVMLGAMGAAGTPVTLLSMTLPTITLALGTAYAIHVLTAAAGADGPDHVEAALRRVSLPVALSGLTTTIGFLSMAAVRIDAVREVGLFGSIGVLGVTAAVLTLLPAILALRPAAPTPPRFSRPLAERLGSALARHAFRHRRRVVAGWLGATALLLVGAARLDVQTDATSWFPPGNPVRDDYEAIRQQLSGISPVNVVVHAGTHGRVTEPAVIAALDGLAVHLEGLDAVGKAVSLADPLRQIHGGFLGDPTQPLPGRRDLSEQYLLLLESVEPIADLVTPDRLTANVVLRVDDNRSGSLLAVAREAERWWARNGPPGTRAQATGTMFEFARAEDEMTYGQLRGLGLAVGALALILLAVFGSPGLVATALVPNLLPVMAMFGCMGLAGVPLDAGTVIVGALALGMAVDDTMHVVTGFHEARLVGADRLDAVRRTLGENLPAVTYTTLVVSLGFGILALSGFTFVRHFGLLIAGVMGVCWLADAHLLPALFARDAKDCAHTASEGRRAA